MQNCGHEFVAIVQARMGSSRLPGKVLMRVGNETVLEKVVLRLSRAKNLGLIVIATTDRPADDVIVAESRRLGIECFRGSEDDVLGRYLGAADAFEAEAIVRITSDCPLIDPGLVDDVVQKFVGQRADFGCNILPRTFPRGLDTEVFTRKALARAIELADQPYHREHVTPVFYERRDIFRFVTVAGEHDCSQHRWTVDTFDDLQLVRVIYDRLGKRSDFGWREALAIVEEAPDLAALNAHVQQKEVRTAVNATS